MIPLICCKYLILLSILTNAFLTIMPEEAGRLLYRLVCVISITFDRGEPGRVIKGHGILSEIVIIFILIHMLCHHDWLHVSLGSISESL